MSLLAHTTSLASARNTITLDPDVKDAWGILEVAGAGKTWSQPSDVAANMPSRHPMGTCRMGNDPAASVVNAHSRTHDVPNLFLADGSNFVTSARQQPTTTIQALAYRAADYAIRAAKRAELR